MDDKSKLQVNSVNDSSEEQISKLKERVEELENSWKRALADYKNLERRTAEEKAEFAEFANILLLQRLLPLVDNLEMLEKHIADTGLKMIVKEFLQILSENGLTCIETNGKVFDSQKMDCTETEEVDGPEDNKVLETLSKGYLYRNKVLRPAKVKVGKQKVNIN